MKKLEDILYKVRILAIHGNREVNANSITIDSRKVDNGAMFIAIKGEKVDGHDFIPGSKVRANLGQLFRGKIGVHRPSRVVGMHVPAQFGNPAQRRASTSGRLLDFTSYRFRSAPIPESIRPILPP